MGEINDKVSERVEARICPGCRRNQDHIIRRVEKVGRHHTTVQIEEECTICHGKRLVMDRVRGNYHWNG